jgi:hypothetical protein
MQFRTIVSAFYLDATTTDGDLTQLVSRAGMRDLREIERVALGFADAQRLVLGGELPAFGLTWAVIDPVEGLWCLQLFSSYGGYLKATRRVDQTLDEMAHARTFGEACLALDPIAALLDCSAHYEDEQWVGQEGNRDWVLAQAKLVAAQDTNALLDLRVGLLYLNDAMLTRWESTEIRDSRDTVDVAGGRLVFARIGPNRML